MVVFFNRGETRTDLKCEGKEPLTSDKMIIDVFGVIRISIQPFTKLVGIGSNSDDMHGASTTRWSTSSAVIQVSICKTFRVLGGFCTRECELEGKDE